MPFSVDYAFTLTLRPKCYIKEPEIQYDDTSDHVRRKLSSLTPAYTLIAELTKSYQTHYHGIISFPLKGQNLIKEFHKLFRNDTYIGFINIRQIDDMLKWCDYLKKDLSNYITIGRRPIIMDEYDVFDENERSLYGITW